MRTRHLARLGTLAAVVTLTTLSVAGPASAAVTDEPGPAATLHGKTGKACLVAARAWTDHAVHDRLLRLAVLDKTVDAATTLTDTHRATLESLIAGDRAGLQAKRAEVRHDSTCAEATADARQVVIAFRVYVLLSPQTTLTIRGDHGLANAETYEVLEPGYAEAIAALPDGPVKTAAQTLHADLVDHVDTAQAAYGAVADPVLALVPTDFPTHAGVLASARAAAHSGGVALTAAALDRAALDALLT